MKESSNPLYQLISEQPQAFKKEFQVQARDSLDNGSYYMLCCPLRTQNKISTDIGEFTPVDAHISIYKEDKKEMEHSAFHLTVNLTNNAEKKYCVHLFYTWSGDYLFSSFRDEQNNFYELQSKRELLNFGKKNIQNFLAVLSGLQQNYNKQYSVLVNKANNLSKLLDNNDTPSKKTLVRYKHSLDELVTFIESGILFNQKHLAGIKMYESLLQDTEQKLNSLQSVSRTAFPVIAETTTFEEISFTVGNKSTEKESPVTKMEELNKKIITLSRKKNRTLNLFLQEQELYQKKLELLKKSDLHSLKKSPKKTNYQNADDEFITVVNKVLQIQDEINRWILDTLRDDSRYNTEQNSLRTLIPESPIKTSVLLHAIVESNRVSIFEYLVAQRKDFDVNACVSNSMLEIAYKKRHIDIFKLLLQHKASPDVIGGNKKPLLYWACEQGRFQEMELLLAAGANPLATNADGFNCFGILLSRIYPQFNAEQLTLFLSYAPDALNQIQGKPTRKCTTLGFACQERWDAGVLFLLEHGADSNIKRDDGLTSLGVCLVNNDLNLFKIMLEHSKLPLKESLDNALDVAVFLKQKNSQDTAPFIQEISRYNDCRQLETHIPEFKDASSRLHNALNSQQKASVNLYNFFHSNSKDKHNNVQDKGHLHSVSKP